MEWFTEQLLPNIPQQSVIILDNATYHYKQKDKPPTTSNRKDDIRKWLDQHNIPYDNDIKKTLLDKVKQHKLRPTYLTDEAAQQLGHTVLRLPVAHCKLNPIELAWASMKGYVAKHNKNFTLKEIQTLTPDGIQHTTVDMWRNFCRHVVDVENNYIQKDGILEEALEEMIIEFGDNSSDEEEEEEEHDELMDEDDRTLIDRVQQSTTTTESTAIMSTANTDTHTNPRRNLSEVLLQQYEQNFLDSVLPLP